MNKAKVVRKTTKSKQHYNTVGDMANDVRGVLKSVIDQDGRYSTQEASVVSNIYGNELRRIKLNVEIHKINSNTSDGKEILQLG